VNGGGTNAAGIGGRGTYMSAALAVLATVRNASVTPANTAPTPLSFLE